MATVKIYAEPMSSYSVDKYDILVYGSSGKGKTIFAGTWAALGKVLFLDSDKGVLSLTKNPLTQPLLDNMFRVELVDFVPGNMIPRGWVVAKGIIDSISTTGQMEIDENNSFQPDTIVIDSLTTISQMCMNYVLNQGRRLGQSPHLADYGTQQRELIDMINRGRAIHGVNFILTAHEKADRDELTGRTWIVPMVTGQLAATISMYFDEVYHAEAIQKGTAHEYVLETKASGLITAKSRLNLPPTIPNNAKNVVGTL